MGILERLLLLVLLFFFIVFEEHGLILHILGFFEHVIGFISVFGEPRGLVNLDFPDVGILNFLGLTLLL